MFAEGTGGPATPGAELPTKVLCVVTLIYDIAQAHPALKLAAKILLGALAITAVYQSQLYAFWLQYIVAGISAVVVAAYGFSRSSLSSSGNCFADLRLCNTLLSCMQSCADSPLSFPQTACHHIHVLHILGLMSWNAVSLSSMSQVAPPYEV